MERRASDAAATSQTARYKTQTDRDEIDAFIDSLYGPRASEDRSRKDRRVPDSKKPETSTSWLVTPTFATLSDALREQTTMTDLFKLANDDAFKGAVASLSADDVKSLRSVYNELRTRLDGKVKLEQFDGQVINLVGIDWWHSDAYDNDGVSLHIRTERDPDKLVKALTSSAPVVTFCNRLRDLPTERKPLRVMLSLVPVRDPERAARGQKIWQIKQMPPARDSSVDGNVPF